MYISYDPFERDGPHHSFDEISQLLEKKAFELLKQSEQYLAAASNTSKTNLETLKSTPLALCTYAGQVAGLHCQLPKHKTEFNRSQLYAIEALEDAAWCILDVVWQTLESHFKGDKTRYDVFITPPLMAAFYIFEQMNFLKMGARSLAHNPALKCLWTFLTKKNHSTTALTRFIQQLKHSADHLDGYAQAHVQSACFAPAMWAIQAVLIEDFIDTPKNGLTDADVRDLVSCVDTFFENTCVDPDQLGTPRAEEPEVAAQKLKDVLQESLNDAGLSIPLNISHEISQARRTAVADDL